MKLKVHYISVRCWEQSLNVHIHIPIYNTVIKHLPIQFMYEEEDQMNIELILRTTFEHLSLYLKDVIVDCLI